jgi:acetyl-CoA synthetase
MMTKTVWHPSQEQMESTRLYRWMQELGFSNYEEFLTASTQDIEWFWSAAEKALGITWMHKYTTTLALPRGIMWPEWYVGGRLNAVQSCLDKWTSNPATAMNCALICENEDGQAIRYSFAELRRDVETCAQGFKNIGLNKGDRVAIYLPMIYETVVAILAIMSLGAIFVPSFSGYAADAVFKRMEGSKAKFLITADGFCRRGKIVPLKEEADKVIAMCDSDVKCIVVRHINRDIPWNPHCDIEWHTLMNKTSIENWEFPTPMDSSDPCMLLYTSGTTGAPKGIVHSHAGFPLKAAFDAGFGMDLKEKDVLFWITDMGWMMGPFLIFGALINGATAVLYEGSVDYPNYDRLWNLVATHGITHLGISPTLVRILSRDASCTVENHDISSLRLICSTGEPWNLEPWNWLFEHVGKKQIPIFNFSGGTEISGGVLGNVLLKPIAPVSFNAPLPGMDIDVFDHHGQPLRNSVGELVIKQPWVGMAQGFWQEPKRYEDTYWSRWPNIWNHSDLAMIDEGGFWTIVGRSDDTLKIAGKRIGPVEIETILVQHSSVLESAVIGTPDDIKGEVAVCFVVLKNLVPANEELKQNLLDLVSEKLSKALRPQALHFLPALPKTRNGKIMRRVMRAAYLDLDMGDLGTIENLDAINPIRMCARGLPVP